MADVLSEISATVKGIFKKLQGTSTIVSSESGANKSNVGKIVDSPVTELNEEAAKKMANPNNLKYSQSQYTEFLEEQERKRQTPVA